MTREDKGHYANKHSSERKADPTVVEAVKKSMVDGMLPCAVAFSIAADLNVPPGEVGFTSDVLEISISKCQLGLYGYGEGRKIVKAAENPSRELLKSIQDALVDGRLPCKAAWDIAARLGLKKMDVSSACENLKVKISSCQLGAF